MRRIAYTVLPVAAGLLVLLTFSSGCRTIPPATHPDDVVAECPAEIQQQVRVTASSVPRTIPAELAVDVDSTRSLLARTVLLSVLPGEAARGATVITSKLSLTTAGGTFRNWAALQNADRRTIASRSIEVIPGRIGVAPFFGLPTLQAQTLYLDVVLVPGAVPLDEFALSPSALWTEDRRALPAETLDVKLTPLRHVTVYDEVKAMVSLTFVASRARGTRERFECSSETELTLIDREAATPALWDLRKSQDRGRSEYWLALFDPATGPFRAVFTSAADADGFMTWLRQTHATRAGRYQLGMFRPQYSREPQHTRPAADSLINTFRPVSADDLDALEVGRLGQL